MSRQADGRVDGRGTVLVVSGSSLFKEIVGHMVADCGFVAEHPSQSEPAWRSIARVHPALIICDCAGVDEGVRRVIAEVSARSLPMLMVWSPGQEDEYVRNLVLPDRIAWITFPIERGAFRSTIDDLLQPATVHRLTLTAAGMKVEAAIGVRALGESWPIHMSVTDAGGAPIPKRPVRRSTIRLLP
jgi:hypothetical protein